MQPLACVDVVGPEQDWRTRSGRVFDALLGERGADLELVAGCRGCCERRAW